MAWKVPFVLLLLIISSIGVNTESPKIERYPQDQTVYSRYGKSMFFCIAIGNPNTRIEWRKNGQNVRTICGKFCKEIDMPNGSVLWIEPVGRNNATYECVAENGVGEPVRAQADLIVVPNGSLPPGFPTFVRFPMRQDIENGSSVVLSCQAEGDPEPTIRWLKKKIPLDMTIPRYTLLQGYSLQITDIKEEDDGRYQCMAENSLGSTLSSPLLVRVRKPRFYKRPDNLYEVMPGSSLMLECFAEGSPMPFVKWKKGLIDLTTDRIAGDFLFLSNISESVNYTCIAESKIGKIETTTQVVVQDDAVPPDTPESVLHTREETFNIDSPVKNDSLEILSVLKSLSEKIAQVEENQTQILSIMEETKNASTECKNFMSNYNRMEDSHGKVHKAKLDK